jgi:hypothetical protein
MSATPGVNLPFFIICRDRVTPLRALVTWLEANGYQRLVLVDNASTYPPLVEYLDKTSHSVVRLPENLGPHRSVWETGVVGRFAGGEHYVVSDGDVVPDDACPGDAVDFLLWALRRYPGYVKAGLGLRIDDLPSHYSLAKQVRKWEGRYWLRPLPKGLFEAPVDTTFAVYRPGEEFRLAPSLRSGAPYLARHTPWYSDSSQRTEEEQYYQDHCDPAISHWDLEGHLEFQKRRLTFLRRVWWHLYHSPRKQRDPAVPRRYRRAPE